MIKQLPHSAINVINSVYNTKLPWYTLPPTDVATVSLKTYPLNSIELVGHIT